MSREPGLFEQEKDWCRHFTGIHNLECRAGVRYDSVRDSTQHPYAWPCIQSTHATTTCAMFQEVTDDEARRKEQETQEFLRLMLEELATGRCPTCHQAVAKRVQVGRCVYAEPCGHRLGQGRA